MYCLQEAKCLCRLAAHKAQVLCCEAASSTQVLSAGVGRGVGSSDYVGVCCGAKKRLAEFSCGFLYAPIPKQTLKNISGLGEETGFVTQHSTRRVGACVA